MDQICRFNEAGEKKNHGFEVGSQFCVIFLLAYENILLTV